MARLKKISPGADNASGEYLRRKLEGATRTNESKEKEGGEYDKTVTACCLNR